MDTITKFVFASPEYQTLGFNVETLTNITINLLTVVATYGTMKQAAQVWKKRTSSGLSGITFSYLFFYCLAFFIYAIEKGACNMVISSLIAFAYIPIIVGVRRFGSEREKRHILLASAVFALLPVIMAMLQSVRSKEHFLGILLAGMLGLLIVGFEKFRRTPGIGSVEPAFPWSFFIAGIFWILYSHTLHETELFLFNIGMVTVMGTTLFLYYTRKRAIACASLLPQ